MRISLALYLCLYMTVSSAEGLHVASAANFYPTLSKIKKRFEEQTQNTVTIIRGSTGKLYAQILHGAPYDVFMSADSVRADKLVKQGKSEGGSYVYAIGQLALWKPGAESSQVIRELLVSGSFNKLAIANPKTAPYGKASIEALKSMEIYDEVKYKLVYGENISQTLQFVESGAADIGFVARSYVNDDIYWEIDSYLHKPIKQKMIVIKHSKEIELAKEFVQYMQTPEIKKIIESDGYTVIRKSE